MKSEDKKIVFYNAARGVLKLTYTGNTQYSVYPMDHTSELVTNGQSVITSNIVVPLDEYGEFETQNSRYRPTFKL